MPKNNNKEKIKRTEIEILEENNKLLRGILLAFALKEEKWENKSKILKTGGLNQTEINNLIGFSENAKRVQKHRAKKKQKIKPKGFLSKLVSKDKK